MLPTVYGQVLVNRHDINQTQHLLQNEKAIDHEDIVKVSQFITPGSIAVDIGACFGLWTLAFARKAAQVLSFEPQRILFQQICGSLALNGIENVNAFNMALGSSIGSITVPRYDYNRNGIQCGGLSLSEKNAEFEYTGEEPVVLITLDNFQLQNVSVIKIDVEQMEMEVLRGARQTIEKNRPVLYIETIFTTEKKVSEFFADLEYAAITDGGNTMYFPKEKWDVRRNPDVNVLGGGTWKIFPR